MARLATGSAVIETARKLLLEAKTIEDLRCAQAVVFPLDFGLSMEETAQALGISKGWVCHTGALLLNDRHTPSKSHRRVPSLAAVEDARI